MKFIKKHVLIIIFVFLILLDQLTKLYVVKTLQEYSIELILDIKLTYVENTGGAFGIAQNSILGFIAINVVVLGIIIRFLYIQKDKIDFKSKFSLYMILAGGIANLLDRTIRGFVVDFIDVTHYIKFPMFNLADMYIVIGWILFAIFTLFLNSATKKIDEEIKQIEDKSRCE